MLDTTCFSLGSAKCEHREFSYGGKLPLHQKCVRTPMLSIHTSRANSRFPWHQAMSANPCSHWAASWPPPAALTLLETLRVRPEGLRAQHVLSDWGDLAAEDWQANERALRYGARLPSAYQLNAIHLIWAISEADRSMTTILKPEDY